MKRREEGLTIIEVLVSIALTTTVIISLMPLFPTALATDAESRARARATAIAESWLDRYREGLEPLFEAGPCGMTGDTSIGSYPVVTCTYPYGHDFAKDTAIFSHTAAAAELNELTRDHRTTITARRLITSSNTSIWTVQVRVHWQQKGEKHVELSTLASN